MTFQEQISKVVKTASEAKNLVETIRDTIEAWKLGRIDAELALFKVRAALSMFDEAIKENRL